MWEVYINVFFNCEHSMSIITPAILNQIVKSGLNTCPVCWMPLFIGDGVEADTWCRVQVLFKNKPSESTEHPFTTERNRPSNVFGMPYEDSSNCNGAHFFHRSSQGKSLIPWDTFWNRITGEAGDPVDKVYKLQQSTFEPEKKAEFFNGVCLTGGIFMETDGGDRLLKGFGVGLVDFNTASFNAVFDRFLNVFAGCRDCNGKMTINEYTEKIFDLVFPRRMYCKKSVPGGGDIGFGSGDQGVGTKRARRDEYTGNFDTEGRVCYLMLSGLIRSDELVKGDGGVFTGDFQIGVVERKKSWRFRVVLIWCQLQILFCLWKLASLPGKFEHHVGYIYAGTADLYMSFLLFSMHNASRALNDTSELLSFESFHYFYSSLYPQYARSSNPAAGLPRNLSLFVLHSGNEDASGRKTYWRDPFVPSRNAANSGIMLNKIRNQIKRIYDSVCVFWEEQFKPLSSAIHSQSKLLSSISPANHPIRYFTSVNNIHRIVSTFEALSGPPTLQKAVDQLSRRLYWLHFNYITMPTIYAAFGARDAFYASGGLQPAGKDAYQAVWNRWYRLFHTQVRALGTELSSPPALQRSSPLVLHSVDFCVDERARLHESLRELLRLVDTMGIYFY